MHLTHIHSRRETLKIVNDPNSVVIYPQDFQIIVHVSILKTVV